MTFVLYADREEFYSRILDYRNAFAKFEAAIDAKEKARENLEAAEAELRTAEASLDALLADEKAHARLHARGEIE